MKVITCKSMALGKGLGALITPIANRRIVKRGQLDTVSAEERIWQIPVGSIQSNPQQPRKYFDPRDLEEMAASIKEHGVLQPILLSEKADGGYELISGERRWRAAKLAGLTEVPAMIKKMADQQKLEVALIENIQREDLTPLEEAFAYRRLMDEFGLTQQEVASRVGKARPTIANMVRLLDLPDQVKEALAENKINMTQARTLLGVKSRQEQLELLSSMFGQKITVRDLERTVSDKNIRQRRGGTRRDPNLLYLEDKLRSVLGTKVMITQSGDKGKIIIDFYSKEELASLIEKLS